MFQEINTAQLQRPQRVPEKGKSYTLQFYKQPSLMKFFFGLVTQKAAKESRPLLSSQWLDPIEESVDEDCESTSDSSDSEADVYLDEHLAFLEALDGEDAREAVGIRRQQVCPVHDLSQALRVPREEVVRGVEEGVRPPLGRAGLVGVGPVDPCREHDR